MEYDLNEIADEFAENGLRDVAEHLREHGITSTRRFIDTLIAEATENDDPEGWVLGNLEVARDRMESAQTQEQERRQELAARIRRVSGGHRRDVVLRLTQGSILAHISAIETEGVRIRARHISAEFVDWANLRAVDPA